MGVPKTAWGHTHIPPRPISLAGRHAPPYPPHAPGARARGASGIPPEGQTCRPWPDQRTGRRRRWGWRRWGRRSGLLRRPVRTCTRPRRPSRSAAYQTRQIVGRSRCGNLGIKLVLTHAKPLHTPGGGAKRHSPQHKYLHTPNGNSANGGAYTYIPRACYPHVPYPLTIEVPSQRWRRTLRRDIRAHAPLAVAVAAAHQLGAVGLSNNMSVKIY